MKCFYHQDVDAIALCKICQRGLCPSCAIEVGKGMACRNRCEDDLVVINEVVDRNIRLSRRSETLLVKNEATFLKLPMTYYKTAIIYFLMGLPCLGFGFYILARTDSSFPYFLIAFGGICVVAALIYYSIGSGQAKIQQNS